MFMIQAEYNLSSTSQTLEEAVFTCAYFGNYYHWLIEENGGMDVAMQTMREIKKT